MATEQKNIEKEFVQHTLQILLDYEGPFGVTLLVNCLLGLIVLPRERGFIYIAERDNLQFEDLGIADEDIRSWGRFKDKERTVARFLGCMRNSIAHVHIESISESGEIESLLFIDKSGFEAVLSIEKIKGRVIKLAGQIQ